MTRLLQVCIVIEEKDGETVKSGALPMVQRTRLDIVAVARSDCWFLSDRLYSVPNTVRNEMRHSLELFGPATKRRYCLRGRPNNVGSQRVRPNEVLCKFQQERV
jgi:hypothetical protein